MAEAAPAAGPPRWDYLLSTWRELDAPDAWDEAGPSVTLHEQPGNGRYDHATTVDLGVRIRLPAPFDVELDTSRFPGPEQWPRPEGRRGPPGARQPRPCQACHREA
ncbi:hypothetical protein [Nocardiopsis quinghaiensis]|uniref:hypothetical protein n=1 Tax=Nocardiopsis quinghaiensis TaxID=464995 RepID=UPI001CC23B96|nr:hypothetical protein [Nocardiopsis quinghaiensis]